MQETTAFEPTIPEAARRYWPLVTIAAVAGSVIGLILATFIFNDSVAATTVLITDPSTSTVFDTASTARPERYLASQVAILESSDIAQSVVDLEQDGDLSPGDVLESRTIISDPEVDLVRIEFVHSEPDSAIAYANAFGSAYEAHRKELTKETFDSAISGLDSSIAAVDEERAAVDAEIDAVTTVPGEDDLTIELESAIRAFIASPSNQASPEEIESILSQLQTLQVIRALEAQSPTLTLLYEKRRDIMERRSQLVVRRDQLLADAALQSTGVVGISEANEAQPAVGRSRVVAITALLGAIAGVTIAYALAMSNRRFDHRSKPEVVLGAPMLAEIPEFRRFDALPVMDDPLSPEAEAFRFAASALVARLEQVETATGFKATSVTITSALQGEGKTIVAINAGMSLATRGKTVLIVDADFEHMTLTQLMVENGHNQLGMTNITEGKGYAMSDVVIPITQGGDQRVDLLTKGTNDVSASHFFSQPITHELFRLLRTGYDYVLIDAPSLLQISYATSLAKTADAVVLVIPHYGKVSLQQEVRKRLETVGARLLGYVYNKAPRRPETKEHRGLRAYSRDRIGPRPPNELHSRPTKA